MQVHKMKRHIEFVYIDGYRYNMIEVYKRPYLFGLIGKKRWVFVSNKRINI